MSKIKGQTALVTGANRGIGRAYVEELIAAGANKIYAAARKPESLEQLFADGNGLVVPIALDVTEPDQIESVALAHPDISFLVNNAGVAGFAGLIHAGDTGAARQEMETNYFGTLNMVRAFAPVLATNGGGIIINMASIASHVNFPVLGSYSVSKAAVHSLTQGIRAELATQGTQVIGVYPGPVDTDMAASMPMEKTLPNAVVRRILEGVEAGEEDIFPDPMSIEMHAGLLNDPKAIEKQVSSMLPG